MKTVILHCVNLMSGQHTGPLSPIDTIHAYAENEIVRELIDRGCSMRLFRQTTPQSSVCLILADVPDNDVYVELILRGFESYDG